MKAKRILSLLLTLVMLVGCTSAFAEAQFPLTTEPVTFKVMARTNSFYPQPESWRCCQHEGLRGNDWRPH